MSRPKKNHRTPTAPEPEVLGPDQPAKVDTARAALSKERKRKTKKDDFINAAVNWLKGHTDLNQGDVKVEVRQLLVDAYMMDPVSANAAAVMGFMKQGKADGRLEFFNMGDKNMVMLAKESDAEAEPTTDTTDHSGDATEKAAGLHDDKSAQKVETKSLGEHLKDAQGRPTRLQFEHSVGTWVNYPRPGVVINPAQILNMSTSGTVTLYDLKTEDGKKVKEVPAFEIEQLPAHEVERIHGAAKLTKLIKHNEDGQRLAQMMADEEAEEVRQAGELKATRNRIKGLREQIDAHLCGVPLDNQLKIEMEDDGTGSVTSSQATAPAAPTTAAERLLGRISGKDVLELTGDNQPWSQLKMATLKAEASTGKPQKIVPITVEQAPGNWVCVDCQDGVAVLLRAYPKAEWCALYEAKFGAPRDLPNQEPTAVQAAGGKYTGCPVKVGRALLYLATLDDALLLRLPAAAAQA